MRCTPPSGLPPFSVAVPTTFCAGLAGAGGAAEPAADGAAEAGGGAGAPVADEEPVLSSPHPAIRTRLPAAASDTRTVRRTQDLQGSGRTTSSEPPVQLPSFRRNLGDR